MIENLFTFVRTLGNQRIEGKKFFTTQIGVLGTLSDGTGTVGTAGKVLSSTGSGVEWITVGGGSSDVDALDDLSDVIITTASSGQLLRFNGTSWVNWTPNFLTAYGSLNDLSDVTLTTPVNGARLIYSSATSQWIDASPLGINKIYYGTAAGDAETTNVITNGTRLSVGTLAMPTNLNVGQVDITTGIVGEGSIHIGGIADEEVYLLASRNKIQVGSQVVTFTPGEGEGDEGETTTTFTPSTLNIQPIGGQTVFGGLVTATGFKTPTGNNKQILLANGTVTSTNSATSGQILRWIESGGVGQWLADDENQNVPTLDEVTDAGNTTTNGITAGSFTTTGAISGGNITGTKVTTPTVEFNGAISTNSVEQVDQGDPNPNVFYAKWNGDVKFTVNGDGYAVAQTGYKVVGATGGFLKANGTIDTNTYLTSYTETQTLDAVTDLGNTTTNAITVGGLTSTSVTTPLIESGGLLIIDADTSGSLQPEQGDPAVPVLSFDWQGSTQGYIDTNGKITFNGFKTPSGTSSGFLKADGSIDTNTYLTSVSPYALDDLTDVNASNPQDGEFLKFDDATGEWINAAIPVPTLDSVTDAGNTTTNTIDVGGITTPYVQFEEVEEAHGIARSINWSEGHNSLEVFYADEKHFDVGQDQMWYVKNGAEENLLKGTVVMAVGAVGNSGKIEVAPLVADGTVSGRYAIGILMDDIRTGEFGFAMTQGTIRGIDTGEFAEGDTLYPSSDTPGALVNVEPASPALKLPIAFVVSSHNNGAIAVRMTQGLDLHEVHDVQITDGANGQLLRLESGIWTNWTPTYITTETDPVFTASPAGSITTTNVSNWDSAYGWGDHALAGYLTTYENNYISDVRISEFIVTFSGEGNAFNGDVDFSELPFAQVTHNHVIAEITGLETALDGKQPVGNYITTETDPTVPAHVKAITEGEIVNWNKAYDWGNHADAGYITSFSETDTLATVTSRGASTSTSVTFSGGFNATGTQDKISSIAFHRLHPTSESPLNIDSLDSFILSKTDGGYGGGTKPTGSHNGFGVISLQTHSGNYFTQIGLDTNQNDLWIRSANETTSFGSWVRLATRDWVTSQGYLTTYENNYISDVRLAESVLSFTGTGAGFTGDIDLSALPFAASSHTHTIADVTGLQTALDGKVPTTRTITINGTALDLSADRSWTISSADGYISDVRLQESTLEFTGEGSAFNGTVDLSTLPFAPQGSYLTAEADTLATVTARGNISNTKIQIRTAGNAAGGNIQLGPYSDGASKWGFITSQHYNSSLEPEGFSVIGGLALNGVNAVVIGGNIYESNPATQIQFWTHSSDTHSTGGTQRGVIDSSGNWGVGTTNPSFRLDVNGTVRASSYLVTPLIYSGGGNVVFGNVAQFNDWVGIGTSNPSAPLHVGNGTSQQQWIVNQSVAGWYSGIKLARGTGNNSSIGNNNYGLVTTDNGLEFVNFSNISDASGVRYGVIAQGGNWGIGTTSPFGRLNVSRAGINEGAISFDDQANNAHLVLAGTDALVRMQLGTYNNGSYGAWIQASYDNGGVNYGAEPLILNPQGGNVGIGTTSPSTKLDVNGVITATGGNSTNWNTAFGWGNNYISDVRLSEYNLEFTGEGSAFTGTIDLSTLPFAASSHTHAASDITSGTLSTDRLPKQELGISILGNFGQWQNHGAYQNLNTDVAYWGWTFAQGSVNAPHQTSSQWYRGRFSLGDEYGFGTNPGDYWMEIAIPRYNQDSTAGNLFVRTCENGGINAWQGVRAAYATTAGNSDTVDGLHASVFVRNDIYNSAGVGLQVIRNIGTIDGSWPDSDHTFGLENSDAGNIVINFHRAGYTSNNLWYNGSKFRFDQALESTGVITASGGNSTNWNTAFGWGNHADASYIKADSLEPLTIQAETVTFTGSVTVEGTFTESSSIRFKENIAPLDPALNKVNQLEAVSYNKIGVDDREIGLIAENVAELFPEVVTYNEEGQPQGIQYQRLSVILLKAMQEQNAVITALTERVNKLENK